MTTIALSWHCLGSVDGLRVLPGCGAGGDGPRSDLAARKHERATGHATVVRGEGA